ncbi:MAG: hypothetical protein U0168_12095 [Nannocystaceae bacterium]
MRTGVVAALACFACVPCGCGNARGDDDGATPWHAVELPEGVASLQSVWSFAPDDVWLAADSGKLLHFDGSEWTTTTLNPAVTVVALMGFAPDAIVGVGGSSLARYDGSAWTVEDLTAANVGIESVSSVWGTATDDLWVGGDQSTAAHFDGTTWTRTIAGSTDNVALWGSATDDVWIGGVFDVAHFDGTTWTTVDGLDHGAAAIWASATDDVWVADGDELSHFDGSGWTATELDGVGGISAMWGFASDDLWGVGDFATIAHYDGQRWDVLDRQHAGSPYLRQLLDVHGSGPGDLWAVGAELGESGATPLLWRIDG